MLRFMPAVAAVFIVCACSPSPSQIQTAIAETQRAKPSPTEAPRTATPTKLAAEEREELKSFCRAFDTYIDRRDAFITDFNNWLDEVGTGKDLEGAHAFVERASDLRQEAREFPRPRVAREVHDLILEYSGSAVDEMDALEIYMANSDQEARDNYSSKFSENILLVEHVFDAFNDLMNEYDVNPVTCIDY